MTHNPHPECPICCVLFAGWQPLKNFTQSMGPLARQRCNCEGTPHKVLLEHPHTVAGCAGFAEPPPQERPYPRMTWEELHRHWGALTLRRFAQAQRRSKGQGVLALGEDLGNGMVQLWPPETAPWWGCTFWQKRSPDA